MINFVYYTGSSGDGLTFKGKPITCRSCKFQFRIADDKNKEKWTKSKFICPSCKQEYCMLPKTETQLRIIQDQFLLNVYDQKVGTQFYLLLKSYIRSLILKHFTSVINDPDEIDYHAHSSASKVLSNYYSRQNFKIESSFASFSMFKIKESLWHKDEYDTGHHSIHETDSEDKLKYDFGLDCSIQKDSAEEQEREDMKKYLFDFLKELIYFNGNLSFKILVSVLNYIQFGQDNIDRLYQSFGVEGKHRYQRVMNRFKEELMKSAKNG